MSSAVPAPVEAPLLPSAVLDKYKAAATVVQSAFAVLIQEAIEGAGVIDLCNRGDELVEQGTKGLYNKVKGIPKGIAFPTCVSVNNTIQNYSPLPSDQQAKEAKLAKGDVVKIHLGAHIDGYAVLSAETLVVGEGPITGPSADLLQAAHQAAELAIRLVKPGGKNWEVTDGLKKLFAEYEQSGIKGVEGILSHQFDQNNIEAKKGLVAFPTEQQRRDGDNAYTFDEGEVYGLNIVVTNGDKTPKVDSSRTTLYQKTSATYLLKMKTSRATFSEISQKAGNFPFTLRVLEDEKRAKMGVQECVQHGLLKGFEVSTTDKPTSLSAQSFFTFAVTKTGAVRLSPAPAFYSADKVKSEVEVKDEEVKQVLGRSLKVKPAKKKKVLAEGENGAEKTE